MTHHQDYLDGKITLEEYQEKKEMKEFKHEKEVQDGQVLEQ